MKTCSNPVGTEDAVKGGDAAMTIPKLFRRNVCLYGRRTALRKKRLGIWRRITWDDYWGHVRDFALGLMELGFRPEDNLSVLGENCPEWLYADLAAQCLRGVTVGICPTAAAQQVRYLLANSESRFVVCGDQEQVDKVLEILPELPRLEKIIYVDKKGLRNYREPTLTSFAAVQELGRGRDAGSFEAAVEATRSDDIAILAYTSGATGDPKGALISHRNLVSMADGLFRVLSFRSSDSLVSVLPLCHMAERMFSLVVPLYAGCTVNFAENVQTVEADLREISPTVFLTVPRILEKMRSDAVFRIKNASFLKRRVHRAMMPIGEYVERRRQAGQRVPVYAWPLYGLAYSLLFRAQRNRLGLLNCRIAVSCAGQLSNDLAWFYHSIGVPVRESYGLTESMGISFMPGHEGIRIGRVGKPVPGIEFQLAEDGEILLRGESVFQGYHRNPELTAAAVEKGWLRTGDVGQLCEDGQLRIVDRKKGLIVDAAGKNSLLTEIGSKLKFSPCIEEAIVIGNGATS